MRPRELAAAALLLAAAWYWRRSQPDLAGDALELDENPDDTAPTWTDIAMATAQGTLNTITATPASQMTTSAAGIELLHTFEQFRAQRYRLGDGGYTIGWGRFYPDSGPPPPETITREQGDAWFAEDVRDRGERWVKAYVTVPLTQSQFDALVSMAYNLSPRSFRKIAEAVNAGDDPEETALKFVRPGSNLERGLRRRRAAELALYRSEGTATA